MALWTFPGRRQELYGGVGGVRRQEGRQAHRPCTQRPAHRGQAPQRVHEQKMAAEVAAAKKERDFYMQQVSLHIHWREAYMFSSSAHPHTICG
eukprot:1161631-Pelagomonas_calceolata.AAC.4